MTKVSKEEVIKIAQISALELSDNEIDSMIKQLEEMLTYAARVKEIVSQSEQSSVQNVNVFREDVVTVVDVKAILAQAPACEDNFYVVPSIIEDK